MRSRRKIHAKAVDDAVMIWVYHDTTPRALSPKIKKYVQAQSWFQDLALLDDLRERGRAKLATFRARRQRREGAGPRRRQGRGLLGGGNRPVDRETAGQRRRHDAAEGVAAARRVDAATISAGKAALRALDQQAAVGAQRDDGGLGVDDGFAQRFASTRWR